MTATKQDVEAVLVRLAEAFPKTFILEKYQPHRPLKVGIAADLMGRCPELDHRKVSVALAVYTRRVMYLRSLVAGAVRVDLDGKPCPPVTRLCIRPWHRAASTSPVQLCPWPHRLAWTLLCTVPKARSG